MQKIISLFKRNYDGDRLVYDALVKGAEWVRAGEGVATQKYDGTCCLVRDGKLFKRFTLKLGKAAPAGFEACSPVDPATGKQEGWVPVSDAPSDKWHREAFANGDFADGTYELVGPKIQGNAERRNKHVLLAHARATLFLDAPRTFDALKEWLFRRDIEGLVWHHSDGRMVKIKKRDFGLRREIG